MTVPVSHPLDHVYYRLDWAKARLGELRSVHKLYVEEEADSIGKWASASAHINPQSGNPEFSFPQPHLIPVSFPILVGEVAHHLRSCLDYLIYRLAILDSGSEQKQTQFPVADRPENFRRNRDQYLKGVNDAHVTTLERLQPYNGVDWTKRLVNVSNPDKHRHLIVSRPQNDTRFRFGYNPYPPADSTNEDSLHILMTLTDTAGRNMYVEVEMVLFIAFDDGHHVINVLEEIEAGVEKTLNDFKPEF